MRKLAVKNPSFKVGKNTFKFLVKDCFDYEKDYYGSDVGQEDEVESPKDCQNLCWNNPKCRYWTFIKKEKVCYFKSSNAGIRYSKEAVSGPKYCRLTGTIPSIRLYLLGFEEIKPSLREMIECT